MATKQLRLIGYYRVSRVGDREGDSFQAPMRYEKTIRDYCKRDKNVRLLDVVGELDVSGSKLDRAKLQREVIQPIVDGKADGVIVPNLSRLSRLKPSERIALIELIENANGVIVSATETLDPSTSAGRLLREILFGVARMQWEDHADNFRASKEAAVARGIHIAGKVPVGYLRGDDGRLVIDEDKVDAILGAFELRATGASLATVTEMLEDALPGGASGDGFWRKGTVKRILANRTYLGEARQGEFTNASAHEAIVDVRTFDAVQALFRRNEPSVRSEAKSLLAGVAYCAHCGYALQNTLAKQRKGADDTVYEYRIYRCRADGGQCKCETPAMAMADALDGLVEAAVLERLSAGATVVEKTVSDKQANALLDRLATARGKRAPFEDPDYVAVLGLQAAKRAIAKVDAEIAEIEEAYAVLTAGMPAPGRSIVELAEAWDACETAADKREVIASMIDSVLVSRAPRGTLLQDRVEIVWVGDRAPIGRRSRGYRTIVEAGVAAA